MTTITKQDRYLGDVVDERPGDYYVSVMDGPRYALLAGPFDTHQEALDMVNRSKKIAQELDHRAVFYGFGTCRMEKKELPRMGILNDRMGNHGAVPGRWIAS